MNSFARRLPNALLALAFLLPPSVSFSAEKETSVFKELKGEHFIVYFHSDEKFAQETLQASEAYYKTIAADLGYARHSAFWTWDKRVKIFVHQDRASYLKATGQPDWSEGMADHANKQIVSYAWSRNFLGSLLPHELAHLIFRDFIGFKGEAPLWLDEGVAQWAEAHLRTEIKKKAKKLYDKDSLLSIGDITRLNIRIINKNEKRLYFRGARTKRGRIGLLMLSPDVLINTYYVEAGSLVGFLIETFGSGAFAVFCRELRDGKTLKEALRFAYPDHIRSLRELEDKWRAYLEHLEITPSSKTGEGSEKGDKSG